MTQTCDSQFFYPKIDQVLNSPIRPQKPEGFRIPLIYFAMVASQAAETQVGPHWHPNADEVAYFLSGEGTVGITPPGKDTLFYEVSAGDAVIFPQGWPHFFRNKNKPEEPLKFLAFFNNPEFTLIDVSSLPVPPQT